MYDVWLNVPALDPGCHWILRSPASTDMAGCGFVTGTWANSGCDNVQLDDTFMVQFCCGVEDCARAGVSVPTVKRTAGAKTSPEYRRTLLAGGGGGLEMFYRNGTKMEPIERGMAPEKRGLKGAKTQHRVRQDEPDEVCTGWEPEGNGYTKPSPETQLVATGGSAGQEITITATRTVEWSTTIEIGASFGIDDIFGLSMSMSQEFSESLEESESRTFQVPEGQQGDIGFTGYLYCEQGKSDRQKILIGNIHVLTVLQEPAFATAKRSLGSSASLTRTAAENWRDCTMLFNVEPAVHELHGIFFILAVYLAYFNMGFESSL